MSENGGMTDARFSATLAELREARTDFNLSLLGDAAEPIGLTCGTLRAAEEIIHALIAERDALRLMGKRALFLHTACWDMADGSGCFIPADSMRRVDEVFGEIGVACGDVTLDEDDERDMLKPSVLLADRDRLAAEVLRLTGAVMESDARGAALQAQRDTALAALDNLLENTEPPPARNCSCHISPPCDDCVDFAGLREAIEISRAAVAAILRSTTTNTEMQG